MSKDSPVGAFEQIQDEDGLPAEWGLMGRRWLIDGGDKPAIFEAQLVVYDDVEIAVQWASCLCCLSQLDGHPFSGILYAAATAMKPVIIGCPEVKPQSILACQEFSKRDVCLSPPLTHRGDAFCRVMLQITSVPGSTSERHAFPD